MWALLSIDGTTIAALVVILVAILVAIALVVSFKQIGKRNQKMASKTEPKKFNLRMKDGGYITRKEYAFFNAVNSALPKEFIAFPNVSLSCITVPTSDKLAYNLIVDKVLDIGIFERDTMTLILAVDLIEPEATSDVFHYIDDVTKKALQSLNINLLEVKVQQVYDPVVLRKNLLNAMPDRVITMLKTTLQ